MKINNFIRFADIIRLKSDKRITAATIRPLIADCTGEIYFTDIQLQEGDKLTGYTVCASSMLKKAGNPPRYQNGVVRGEETVILFNTGETSAGLDIFIYPKENMAENMIEVSQGMGSHSCRFLTSVNAGDVLALKASTRESLKNGLLTHKKGFFQYTAAYDSKHHIKVEDKKSARVYLEYAEMLKGQVL
ncbi:MAG: hypothetical protein GX364_07260 [Firmicutes bacterium]|jgi:hypothetical protein|nr:hypothetical protein [Bacillota bacterium]